MSATTERRRLGLDHIDLRVPDMARARPFYAVLLPVLGFTKDVSDDK